MQPVIYLCPSFPIISETFISDQVQALIAAGIPVHVLALSEGNSAALLKDWAQNRRNAFTILYPRGINTAAHAKAFLKTSLRILARPSSWALTLEMLRTAPRLVLPAMLYAGALKPSHTKGSLLVCHFGTVGYTGQLLRAWGYLNMPQVSVFHGFDISTILKRKGEGFYKSLFNARSHTSLTITKFWQNRLTELGDPAPQLIKLGVDLSRFTYTPRTMPKGRPVRFISVGRLTHKKGYQTTLEALALLPQGLEWEYHLIGGGSLKPELQALAERRGIASRVTFHGGLPHSQTQQMLASADAFILASHTAPDGDMEALPIALLEAAATGIPVITSSHSAIPEFFTHGVNGLIAPEKDAPALATNIKQLLTEPKLWKTLTTNAHADMQREQDFATHIKQFIAFIKEKAA